MDSGTRRSVASGTSGENNTRCSGYAVALGMRQIDLVAALGISEIAHLAMSQKCHAVRWVAATRSSRMLFSAFETEYRACRPRAEEPTALKIIGSYMTGHPQPEPGWTLAQLR